MLICLQVHCVVYFDKLCGNVRMFVCAETVLLAREGTIGAIDYYLFLPTTG